jgi:methylated-DNA-[protein]-cysteine S-methyltransferase
MKKMIDVRRSRFGDFAVIWSDSEGPPAVCRVVLPRPGTPAADIVEGAIDDLRRGTCTTISDLAERIGKFLDGGAEQFDLDIVRMESCSEFQQMVLRAEHRIPYGNVSTYGRIAEHLGRPGGSRAVGNALANNPFPIIIPCHRAVRSDLTAGGYQGGTEMKRSLLKAEGNIFDSKMRIVDPKIFY